MKKALLASFVLLAASVAVAGNYTRQSITPGTKDLTTMTSTISAWKAIGNNQVCQPGTLVTASRVNLPWCIDSTGHITKWDRTSRQFVQQTSMGTGVVQIAVHDAANVYSLQRVGHCGVYGGQQFYGVFRWIGSWSEDSSLPCLAEINAPSNGMLAGIGWDSSTSQTAWFLSAANPGATWPSDSWTLKDDGFVYVDLGDGNVGCGVDAVGGIWEISTSGTPKYQLPALPSGANRAVGCLIAQVPSVALAWTTTTGSVYAMPLENWGTWQNVSGLSVFRMAGTFRIFLFGEDLSGHVNHWNVNAPGAHSMYGGQWTTQQGCPGPSSPCPPSITHTVSNQVRFSSGHGINGIKYSSTQVFTNDILVDGWDYSPGCDPIFGIPADPECRIDLAAEAKCNASHQDLGTDGSSLLVADSVDVMDFDLNVGSSGPVIHDIVPGGAAGYWEGTVINAVKDGCAINDPVPVCPAFSPANLVYRAWWYGQTAGQEGQAWELEMKYMDNSRAGNDDPYVYTSFYLATVDANGNIVGNPICFGPGDQPYAWGVTNPGEPVPACK